MAVSSKVDLTVSGVLRRYNEDGTSKFIPEYGRLETGAITSDKVDDISYSVRLPWRGFDDGPYMPNIIEADYSRFIWNHPSTGIYSVDDYYNSNDYYKAKILALQYCKKCGGILFPWNKNCKCRTLWNNYRATNIIGTDGRRVWEVVHSESHIDDELGVDTPTDEDVPSDNETVIPRNVTDNIFSPIRHKNLPEVYTREERIFWSL